MGYPHFSISAGCLNICLKAVTITESEEQRMEEGRKICCHSYETKYEFIYTFIHKPY